ncbi:MAG: phosphate--acyl-ACP acyltransferase [Clostridia bacterium]|nr:phosphate--acyl-ACP acyltransferase [Clostridia bacterium]
MRIIVDAMGGDNAPAEIVKGAVEAIREFGVSITLVGREEEIAVCLKNEYAADLTEKIRIVNAMEIINMEDDPTTVLRAKKDSSMSVALRLLKDGEGDACISAGSTGALLTGATLIVKRVNGIRRAALAPVLPNGGRGVMLIDCRANVDCTTEYLLQFAFMGSFYAKNILGCMNPRVGLLNVGTEETKGGTLQNETFEVLKAAGEAAQRAHQQSGEHTNDIAQVDGCVVDGQRDDHTDKGTGKPQCSQESQPQQALQGELLHR